MHAAVLRVIVTPRSRGERKCLALDPTRLAEKPWPLLLLASQMPQEIHRAAPRCVCAGTSRPSVLAVLRLMINSSFVACMTGRSAGFSPLRMRPAHASCIAPQSHLNRQTELPQLTPTYSTATKRSKRRPRFSNTTFSYPPPRPLKFFNFQN